jgi:hypothetical protein
MNINKTNLRFYLDMEPEFLRVGKFQKLWTGLKCLSSESINLEREMIPWLINDDLQEIFSLVKNKFELKEDTEHLLNISLPVSQSIIKTVDVPILDSKDIREAIKFHTFWENLIQLPGAIEDYSIVYEIVRKNKVKGVSTLFVLVVKKEILTHIVDTSNNNGFKVNAIEPRFVSLIKLFYEEKKIKNKKDFILVEIGPIENYLIVFSNNIPTVINLFLSQQDKLNIQKRKNDSDYNQKLTRKYVSQIEQAINSKTDLLSDAKTTDLYIYSKHNNSFDFEAEFRLQMSDYSVELISSEKWFDLEKFHDAANSKGSEIIYGMSRENKFIEKRQRWISTFNLMKLFSEHQENLTREPLCFKLKLLFLCIIFTLFYFWNEKVDQELKFFENKLVELIDKKKYHSNKKIIYKKLINRENIIKKKKKVFNYFSDNQSKLLLYQKTINNSISKGIWFKSEIFENESGFLIAGIAISDKGIIEFIEALRDTNEFVLVNIDEIKVIENGDRSLFKLREFKIRIKI